MADREEFKAKTRRAAHARAGGVCEWVENGFRCESVLGPGNCEYDHVIPYAISRDSSLENCQVLCRTHHSIKTTEQDQGWIAKTRHQRDGNIGAKVRKGPPIRSPGFASAPREPKRLDPSKVAIGNSAIARQFGIEG